MYTHFQSFKCPIQCYILKLYNLPPIRGILSIKQSEHFMGGPDPFSVPISALRYVHATHIDFNGNCRGGVDFGSKFGLDE